MKIIFFHSVLILLLVMGFQTAANAQTALPKLFTPISLTGPEGTMWMLSLSELLPVSEDPGDEAVRLLDQLNSSDSSVLESVKYIELSDDSRRKLLEASRISETDDIFVFDVSVRRSYVIPVNTLKAVAVLNTYVEELPVSEADYFVGFDLSGELGQYSNWIWLTVGQDPFEKGGLKNIRWKPCSAAEFPSARIPDGFSQTYDEKPLQPDSCFSFYTKHENLYLRNYSVDGYVAAKHLVITDRKSGLTIYENVYELCENCSFAPDTEQYFGRLIKGCPDVIFGFVYPAYTCPVISVIDGGHTEIVVSCDNRN